MASAAGSKQKEHSTGSANDISLYKNSSGGSAGKISVCYCFVTWSVTFMSACHRPNSNVLHCMNLKHQIFRVPDMHAMHYVALRAAVSQTGDLSNNSCKSEYKIGAYIELRDEQLH